MSEIRAALGNDERLMAETLARATLVDRLCRSFLAADTRVATREWDTWWAESAPRFDPYRARTVVEESPVHATIATSSLAPSQNGRVTPDASSCTFQDVWGKGLPESLPSGIGLLNLGGDRVLVRNNVVMQNNTAGIIVIQLPPAVASLDGRIDPIPDYNQIRNNVVLQNGGKPDPKLAPLPASDLIWACMRPGQHVTFVLTAPAYATYSATFTRK